MISSAFEFIEALLQTILIAATLIDFHCAACGAIRLAHFNEQAGRTQVLTFYATKL